MDFWAQFAVALWAEAYRIVETSRRVADSWDSTAKPSRRWCWIVACGEMYGRLEWRLLFRGALTAQQRRNMRRCQRALRGEVDES